MIFTISVSIKLTKSNNIFTILRSEGLPSWDTLEKDAEYLFSEAEKLNMPSCLSHNDLWHTNILYDEDTGNEIDHLNLKIWILNNEFLLNLKSTTIDFLGKYAK